MELKRYQVAALDRLRAYLERSRITDPAEAYAHVLKGDEAAQRYAGPYTPIPGLAAIPYGCIRIPTGGGKTLLGAHAIKVASGYVERDKPLVVWLCPSTIIAEQTRDALKDPTHPYRRALDDGFGGAVRVLDISERRLVTPQDLADKCVVFVGTMQAFRTSSTEGRLVYADDEAFEPHFRTVNESAPDLERNIDGKRKGLIKISFANLLHLWRPVMILDEAHNFVTGLSNEVHQRLNPACVIEFTATPQAKSNTIFAVSARELHDAHMIKLPIMLSEHKSWEAAVAGAVAERNTLAAVAATSQPYLRPITLFQAQPATADAVATVDVLKAHLIENERVAPEAIAVATGNVRDLDGIDLKDPNCPIEHVITVAALKEGWDCSFAYVFCSLANIGAPGAVEQLLGRVLRQPDAKRRAEDALNRAYAHVSSKSFAEAASALKDRLVNIGFDAPGEAAAMIIEQTPALPLEGGKRYLEPEPLALAIEAAPDLSAFTIEEQRAVRVEVRDDGAKFLHIAPDASRAVIRAVALAVDKASAAGAAKRLEIEAWAERIERQRAPAAKGIAFAPIPRLMATVQGELELVEADTLIDLSGWRIDQVPTRLEPHEFGFDETANVFRFDLDGEALTYRIEKNGPELALDYAAAWDSGALSRWLDRTIDHWHTGQAAFLEFNRRLIQDLIERRGFALGTLVRGRYALRRQIEAKVRAARIAAAVKGTAQLFDLPAVAVVEPEHAFSFDPKVNPATSFHEGAWQPTKHYYPRAGAMNPDEIECAQAIEQLPGLKHWVRNGDRGQTTCFWLPTSTDRFYPDFIAEFDDGRLLVVESKGAHLLSNDDTKEKDNIGKRWAERSGGRARFVTASKGAGRPALIEQLRAALTA